jgi:hypothetical protein
MKLLSTVSEGTRRGRGDRDKYRIVITAGKL